jgi:hypothetical protein
VVTATALLSPRIADETTTIAEATHTPPTLLAELAQAISAMQAVLVACTGASEVAAATRRQALAELGRVEG